MTFIWPALAALGSGLCAALVFRAGWRAIRRRWPLPLQGNVGAAIVTRLPVSPLTKIATRRQSFELLFRRSGAGPAWRYERVLRYKEAAWWGAVFTAFLLSTRFSVLETSLYGAALLAFSLRFPELYLRGRARRRLREAERDLPALIDVLRLYVSAGQNLEAAITSAARRAAPVWREILASVLAQARLGGSIAAALAAADAKLLEPSFHRLRLALGQALALGVPLQATLAVQSELVRARRRQQTEEAARQASVKIALPLVLCIFPALLIVYLAPAVLKIMRGL